MSDAAPWLTVIGLGEDGLSGLSAAARAALDAADLLVGARRLLQMVPEGAADRIVWAGLDGTLDAISAARGRRVVVLASGNPMWFGVGSTLARTLDPREISVYPAPSAFSLACSRMGWAMQDAVEVSAHAFPLESIGRHLFPGARLVVLSRDGDTPAGLAAYLSERGFGPSRLTVFEAMGGARERRVEGSAAGWPHPAVDALNTVAIEVAADADARIYGLAPGLPDEAFLHDGMLTKREVRAVTLAALSPRPGETLWDVGAGNGSISIEWLRLNPSGRAVAIERDRDRAQVLRINALRLGAPTVEIVEGLAPEALDDIAGEPDAIFIGGGLTSGDTLAACWERLAAGGRMVVNVVALESAALLFEFQKRNGGTLTQLAIARNAPVGAMTKFEPMAPVIQYAGVKA
ncbi:precorrin-6y C5,15-methyltransferase (decarboxylating) subunit CbiE [Oleispirillum naphthae]|uniref:precorrin-6y C5,15-methyltransferase (decarboxylating) subunit CbiE n=1 Tax=Oleispirillum naphthae TaxID=2838853 RepID=UPI00308237FB